MNYDKKSLNFNLMTTAEAASYLQMSRQRLGVLVKEIKIVPIKKFPQGMIFLRSDIYDFKNKNKEIDREIIFSEYEENTSKSLKFYHQNIQNLEDIQSIFIYFDDFDAIAHNFYAEDNFFYSETFRGIKSPSLIIRDVEGKEIWLSGCKCGYLGTGSRGTRDLLLDLVEKGRLNLNLSVRELEKVIYSNRVINIFVDSDSNSADIVPMETEINVYHEKGSELLEYAIYMENSVPVLLQSNSFVTNKEELFFNSFRAFVPEPEEIIIYQNRKSAREDGYVLDDDVISRRIGPFQLIIKDKSGRELWLQINISKDSPIEQHSSIPYILTECGFDIKNEVSSNSFIKLLDKGFKIISGSDKVAEKPIRLMK